MSLGFEFHRCAEDLVYGVPALAGETGFRLNLQVIRLTSLCHRKVMGSRARSCSYFSALQ